MSKKKKVEITIKDDDGNVTYYKQEITNGEIKIPFGKIHEQLRKGQRNPKETVH